MHPTVQDLLSQLSNDPGFADRFFADPVPSLHTAGVPPEEWAALMNLDREALVYMGEAAQFEPELAPEHPDNHHGNRWVTAAIGLWCCAAFVVFWLFAGSTG